MRSDASGALSPESINAAVAAHGLAALAFGVAERFSAYFELLQRWNAKLNLTAIRSPEGILQRHFLECIFCAQKLPLGIETLLDYGSGAGFPGLPIALCRPEIRVTLAESQGKKASFLREAVRVLGVSSEVYAGRVEEMTVGRTFDAVALRAVDRMGEAVKGAAARVSRSGWLVALAGAGGVSLPDGFTVEEVSLPWLESGVLVFGKRNVPRGTISLKV